MRYCAELHYLQEQSCRAAKEALVMEQNEVVIAFNMVLEAIDNAIAALNQQGAQAFQSGKYDIAGDLTEKGKQIRGFRTKVSELQKEWLNIFAAVIPPRAQKRSVEIAKRMPRGQRTHTSAYRVPILQSLVELGGSATTSDVLDKVEAKMRHQLNDYDRSPLASNHEIRWRKTAQWARYDMVKEGLLSSHSPRGIWEITEAGRRWLAEVAAQKE
jgi:restriction system protein